MDMRGGKLTADHIDVLGSEPLNRAILLIAAGQGHLIKENLHSEIDTYAKRIKWE